MNRDFDTCADVRSSRPTSGGVVTRACTCHPDDNPPTPCPRKYALGECREAAKAAPVQEPVAWIQPDHLQKARVAPFLCRVEPTKRMSDFVPLYAAPQQRKPLTDEQIDRIRFAIPTKAVTQRDHELARAIERAHGIGEAPSPASPQQSREWKGIYKETS